MVLFQIRLGNGLFNHFVGTIGQNLANEAQKRINSEHSSVHANGSCHFHPTWWRQQMGTFSALLALCAGNAPVTGELPSHRSVTRSFGVFFDLRLDKRLSEQLKGWWFETPSRSLWRRCNNFINFLKFGQRGPKANQLWKLIHASKSGHSSPRVNHC